MRHAWHWSTPVLHVHARRNDGNLLGRYFIIAHEAEFCPLRPGNEPTRGPETVAVKAPFPSLQPLWASRVLIKCAQLVILERCCIERDNAGDLTDPALGENSRHLRVEKQGIKPS